MCPGDNIVKDQVIFCLEPIALRPAACECIEHDDPGPGLNAHRRRVLPCDEDTKLIHNGAGKRRLLSVKKLIFAIVKIRCSLGQGDAADSLILYLQVAIMKPDRVCGVLAVLPVHFQ